MMRRRIRTAGRRAADPLIRSVFGSFVLLAAIRLAEPLLFQPGYYADLSVHPFWIVVVLVAMQEGLFAGVAAAGMASLLMQWPARPLDMDITAHYATVAIVPIQWILSAVLLGAYRQVQIASEDRVTRENADLRAANEVMAEEIERLDAALSRLELRAATRRDGQPNAERGLGARGPAGVAARRSGAAYAPWKDPSDRLTVFGPVDHGLSLLQSLAEGVPAAEPAIHRMCGGDDRELYALARVLRGEDSSRPGWIALVLDTPDPTPEETARLTRLAREFEVRDPGMDAGDTTGAARNVVLLQSRKDG